MKRGGYVLILATFSMIMGCKVSSVKSAQKILTTKILTVEQLTPNVYKHISYLDTESYGKVPCNGMVWVQNGEAIVFDTPIDNNGSRQLLEWITSDLKAEVKAVVITHFHVDCLGGLGAFHDKKVKSYANHRTIALAKEGQSVVPEVGFDEELVLTIGNDNVINSFMGEGHTKDNIVSYLEKEKVLFGGCLIKALGAGKGNLADANVAEWSMTIKKVKERFRPNIVIPGHGAHGGKELLDYTIEKFQNQ